MIRHLFGALAALTILAGALPAAAAEDITILTVSGKISAPNRGPMDPATDSLFAFRQIAFQKARTFTRAELLGLPQQTIQLHYPNWPAAVRFRGPWLLDVLAKAGWLGSKIRADGLDGYTFEFDAAQLRAGNFILAIDADGKSLAIGGKGPAWLVFPTNSYPGQPKDSDKGLVWALFHIAVE